MVAWNCGDEMVLRQFGIIKANGEREEKAMRENGIRKMAALLLAAVLCTSLCTGFAAEAEEISEGAEDRTDQIEAGLETEDTDAGQEKDGNGQERKDQEAELSEKTEQKMSSRASAFGLSDPDTGSNIKTWDCVWFGSYPQSEVTSSDSIYSTLQSAGGWDSKNEISMDGNRYRRTGTTVNDYRYFKYERIKWRVLKINENEALLLSDVALDVQQYNIVGGEITWEKSTIRSWLNGYNGSANQQGKDYSGENFIDSAFIPEEQSAIQNGTVQTPATGNVTIETQDKIFLLSASEACDTSYGFASECDTNDEARKCKSSAYAQAMGIYSNDGVCNWHLRTPGYDSDTYYDCKNISYVTDGYVQSGGGSIHGSERGVRAALNVNLSSNQWSKAGTVNSDGTTDEIPPEENNDGDGEDNDKDDEDEDSGNSGSNSGVTIQISGISLSGISKKIAAGKKITLTAKVSPSNATNQLLAWKSNNTKVATVSNKGIVSIKKNTGGKTVTITAAATDGSGKKATYKITSMKGVVKKAKLSGISRKIAAGKKMKLTAKVTASKGANKKLSYKSGNTKVATVSSKGIVTIKKNTGGKTVTITAAATDGSGKKATYKITSMKGVVKKVTISGKKTRTLKAGKILKLKAKVKASNSREANKRLKWTSSNKKYATVSSTGKVKTKKAGKGKTVKITAAATDGSNKKATVNIKLK